MITLTRVVDKLTVIARYIAITILTLMMLLITVAVLSRTFYKPVIGDIELIELSMVTLIMMGIGYTQKIDGHISVEIIVNKLPKKAQVLSDIVASFLTLVVTFIVAYIYFKVALFHLTEMNLQTVLLAIPHYPFDFIISIGFFLWGLQAFLKLVNSIIKFITPNTQ